MAGAIAGSTNPLIGPAPRPQGSMAAAISPARGNLLRKSAFLTSSMTRAFQVIDHPLAKTSPRSRRTSPQAPREPSGARVDAALPADELVQSLGSPLYTAAWRMTRDRLLRVLLSAFGRVGGALDDGGKGVRANIQEFSSHKTRRLRSTMRRELGSPMVRSDTSCVMVRETVSMVSPR
jgi:hypothetical protein